MSDYICWVSQNLGMLMSYHLLFVCLFAWGLTALSAQIGYIARRGSRQHKYI